MTSQASRKMIAALQVSLDGFIQGPEGEKDWADSWASAFGLIPDVDMFVPGARMYPDYGEYWKAILANPDRVPPFQERVPSQSEIAYARKAVQTPHVVLSTTLRKVSWPPNAQIVRQCRRTANPQGPAWTKTRMLSAAHPCREPSERGLDRRAAAHCASGRSWKRPRALRRHQQTPLARSLPGKVDRGRQSHRVSLGAFGSSTRWVASPGPCLRRADAEGCAALGGESRFPRRRVGLPESARSCAAGPRRRGLAGSWSNNGTSQPCLKVRVYGSGATSCLTSQGPPYALLRSRVRAREPVEWPALGVGDRQDEYVMLVLFERDHVGEPLDGRLADQRAFRPRARPCRVGFWGVADSIEGSRNLGDELVAQSWTSLVVPECGAAKLGLRLRM